MTRISLALSVLLTFAALATVAAACAKPGRTDSAASATGLNPASQRMADLAGIPPETENPYGHVLPNPDPLLDAGRLAGANTEAATVQMAARAYLMANPAATLVTSDDLQPSLVSGLPRARYHISLTALLITRVDSVAGGWPDLAFSLSQQKWVRGTPDNDHDADQDIP